MSINNSQYKGVGSQSVRLKNDVFVYGMSSVCGKKEKEGPLGELFDYSDVDPYFGQDSWEKAESYMQNKALEIAVSSSAIVKNEIRYLFAGDLLGQLIATSFGLLEYEIPFFGIYGACSTMGEGLGLAAMMIDGGFARMTAAVASSHYASAQKQFRFPLDYGNQRPLSATWTVTGAAGIILGNEKRKIQSMKSRCFVKITGITTGKIIDYGIKDTMNMGACMAPAAANVIEANLKDFSLASNYYDKIITGDLGVVGSEILTSILKSKGIGLKNHMDCGVEIYNNVTQDTHSGGSGCGCSGIVLAGYILRKLCLGEFRRILFIPTGALMSPVSFNEGESIPVIAHGVVFESEDL